MACQLEIPRPGIIAGGYLSPGAHPQADGAPKRPPHGALYVCMYVCIYVCIYVSMYLCIYVWMYGWMYDLMYGWMYGCMYGGSGERISGEGVPAKRLQQYLIEWRVGLATVHRPGRPTLGRTGRQGVAAALLLQHGVVAPPFQQHAV